MDRLRPFQIPIGHCPPSRNHPRLERGDERPLSVGAGLAPPGFCAVPVPSACIGSGGLSRKTALFHPPPTHAARSPPAAPDPSSTAPTGSTISAPMPANTAIPRLVDNHPPLIDRLRAAVRFNIRAPMSTAPPHAEHPRAVITTSGGQDCPPTPPVPRQFTIIRSAVRAACAQSQPGVHNVSKAVHSGSTPKTGRTTNRIEHRVGTRCWREQMSGILRDFEPVHTVDNCSQLSTGGVYGRITTPAG